MLYEVITVVRQLDRLLPDLLLDGLDLSLRGLEVGPRLLGVTCARGTRLVEGLLSLRITSYNVCYTKLLRITHGRTDEGIYCNSGYLRDFFCSSG